MNLSYTNLPSCYLKPSKLRQRPSGHFLALLILVSEDSIMLSSAVLMKWKERQVQALQKNSRDDVLHVWKRTIVQLEIKLNGMQGAA